MANCLIGFPNQIDAVALTGGAFVATMPLTKVQGRKIKDVARTIDTQRQNTYINIDQQKPSPVRALAIINHNFGIDAKFRMRGTNEGVAQNLIRGSEQFADSMWGNTRVKVFPNQVVAPDGKRTASKLAATTSAAGHYVEQYPVIDASATYTRSVFVKAAEHTRLRFELYSRPTTNNHLAVTFDMVTGVFSSPASRGGGQQSYYAEKHPDGWWRVVHTFNLASQDAACTYRLAMINQTNSATSFTGDGTSGFYAWGAQLELGSAASSYWSTPPTFTSRSSAGMYWDANFVLQSAPANTARFTYDPAYPSSPPRLLFEPAATNVVRNNTMQGGAVGVPGDLPNYWGSAGNWDGLVRSVVGKGVENGIDYVDIQYAGTVAVGNVANAITFDANDGAAAASGQIWTASVFLKLVDGSLAGLATMPIGVATWQSGTVSIDNFIGPDLKDIISDSNLTRFEFTPPSALSVNSATVQARLRPITGVAGSIVNFTLRVGLPQLERNFMSMPIKTSSAAAGRSADVGTYSQNRPVGYMDDWQDYGYSSGWQDVWPAVYPYGTKEWEDPSWWGGKYSKEELEGYTASLIHLTPSVKLMRYWRVEINDTENPAGYLQFGRMFIGPAWQPGINMSYGANLALETDTEVQKSLGGAESYDVRTPYRVQRYKLESLSTDEAMANVFEIQRRAGTDKEVLWVFDPEDNIHALRNRFLGRLRTLSPIEFPYFNQNAAAFEIKEIQ